MLMAALLVAAALTAAQDAPQTPAPPQTSALPQAVVPPTVEAAPAANEQAWKLFSASTIRSYLLDTRHTTRVGDVAAATVAQVPLNVADPAGDHSFKLIDIEVQCPTHQSRVIAETPYDQAGVAQDREELGETFAAYSPGGMDAAVANLLCDDREPAGQAYPTIAAYIDAGRK